MSEKVRKGRTKGTPNKRTQETRDLLDSMGLNPIEKLAKVAEMAMQKDDLQLAGNMYKELAKYYAPQLKAVEVSTGNPLEFVQRIERVVVSPTDTDS